MNRGTNLYKYTRVLYLLLAACMLLSILPISLFASAETVPEQQQDGTTVATPTDQPGAGQEEEVPLTAEVLALATPTNLSQPFTMKEDSTWGTLPYYSLQLLNQNPVGTDKLLMKFLALTKDSGDGMGDKDSATAAALYALYYMTRYSYKWYAPTYSDGWREPRFDLQRTDDPQGRYRHNVGVMEAWIALLDTIFEEGGSYENVAYYAGQGIDLDHSEMTAPDMDGIYINGDIIHTAEGFKMWNALNLPVRANGEMYATTPGVHGRPSTDLVAAKDPAPALRALAASLAANEKGYVRGTVEETAPNVYTLTHNANSGIGVFELPAGNGPAIQLVGNPGTATPALYVINIPGKYLHYHTIDINALKNETILFNFYEAETIMLSGDTGGSLMLPNVLAPNADVLLGGNMTSRGNLVFNTLTHPNTSLTFKGLAENMRFPIYKDVRVEKHCVDQERAFTFYLMQEDDGGDLQPVPDATYWIDGSLYHTGADGSFVLHGGEAAEFLLPIGNSYGVFETRAPDGEYTTELVLDNRLLAQQDLITDNALGLGCEITLNADSAGVTLDVYNYLTESLVVEKQLDAALQDTHAQTAFSFCLKDSEGNPVKTRATDENGLFSLKANAKAVFYDLPAGSYTLEEAATADTRPVFTGASSVVSTTEQSMTFLLDGASQEAILVTNVPPEEEAATNTLRFTKRVVSEVEADLAMEFGFTLTLSGEGAPETLSYTVGGDTRTVANGGTFLLKHEETAVFAGIPVGLTYTFEEPVSGFTQAWGGAERTGTVPEPEDPGDAVGILCTNTRRVDVPKTNTIRVKKRVESQHEEELGGQFAFALTLTGKNAPISMLYTVGSETRMVENGGTFLLKNGEEAVFESIPAGLAYAVSENAPAFTQVWTGAEQEGRVPTQEELEDGINLLCTNRSKARPTVDRGTLSVEKVVSSSRTADRSRYFTFTLTVAGEGAPENISYTTDGGASYQALQNGGTFTLKHGETAQFVGLVAGLSYQVTETAAGFTQSWTGAARTGTIVANTNQAVRCTNTREVSPTPTPTPRPTPRPSPTPGPNNPGFVPDGPEPIPLGNVPGTAELLEDDIPLGMPDTGSLASYAALLIALLAFVLVGVATVRVARKI